MNKNSHLTISPRDNYVGVRQHLHDDFNDDEDGDDDDVKESIMPNA